MFFFSSRRRHTRWNCDWSSDVCSSDLASGGGLSRTVEGNMLLSATWGLGSAIAQGEVVPDRIVLSRQGFVRKIEPGRKDHRETCGHGRGPTREPVAAALVTAPCLEPGQAVTLGRMLRKAEEVLGTPVEIEWAIDEEGPKLLQARPLQLEPAHVPDEIWLRHPGLSGHPAGDRKSTRLNSSHSSISYAVFCLKKKSTLAYPGGASRARDVSALVHAVGVGD